MKHALNTPPDDPLITTATAIQLAGGVSRTALLRWRKAGVLPPPIVILGRNYWRRSAFEAAIAKAAGEAV